MEFTLDEAHCGTQPAIFRTTPEDHKHRRYGPCQLYCPTCHGTWTHYDMQSTWVQSTWVRFGVTTEMIELCSNPDITLNKLVEEARQDVVSWLAVP